MQSVVAKRFIKYTKVGEVVSKPDSIKWQKMYHPILGEYDSEIIQQKSSGYIKSDSNSNSKINDAYIDALQSHPRLAGQQSLGQEQQQMQLMQMLRNNPPGVSDHLKDSIGKLRLGQVIYLRRRTQLDGPVEDRQLLSVFGLIIQLNLPIDLLKRERPSLDTSSIYRRDKLEANPFVRVRGVISNVGVEYKIPLYSPLLHDIHILKESPLVNDDTSSNDNKVLLSVTGGLNLFGVRGDGVTYKRSLVDAELSGENDQQTPDCVEKLSKYININVLSDKGRMAMIRQLNAAIRNGESLDAIKASI
ncbi:hypothetical protein MIR68_007659 [Amoeboaphelidium protococcarum]|nr:hypothetical protein MIR68_007659 [Amoeboaphelidium protococcarum]